MTEPDFLSDPWGDRVEVVRREPCPYHSGATRYLTSDDRWQCWYPSELAVAAALQGES
jgi:hypothetical protein